MSGGEMNTLPFLGTKWHPWGYWGRVERPAPTEDQPPSFIPYVVGVSTCTVGGHKGPVLTLGIKNIEAIQALCFRTPGTNTVFTSGSRCPRYGPAWVGMDLCVGILFSPCRKH